MVRHGQVMAAAGDHYRSELLEGILPFWLNHGLDREYGGVLTCLDRDGSVYDTDKSVWFQGRFGWLLGTLCLEIEPQEQWLAAAESCVAFLRQHCWDNDGRMFFTTTREGRPLRKRRYAFSEMFAAMALAASGAAASAEAVVSESLEVFRTAASRMIRPGGIEPKTIEETRATASLGGPMIILGTAQAIRRSLILSDSLTETRRREIDRFAADAIDTIEKMFVRPELEAVLETVAAAGHTLLDHADGRLVNPGHAIEAAWFVMAEGTHRGEQRWVELGVRMLRWSWRLGWDPLCGGLFYFRDVCGKPCTEYWHDMKFWWPHNEAEIATLMAWRLTGDDEFGRWYREVHDWSRRRFADPVEGEWYGWLRRDGEPTHHAKGSLWKGPFHLPRMQLVCSQLLENSGPLLPGVTQ